MGDKKLKDFTSQDVVRAMEMQKLQQGVVDDYQYLQDEKLEEAVLGQIMLESNDDETYSFIGELKEEFFSTEKRQIICRSILELFNEGTPPDTLSVTVQVKKHADNISGYDIAILTQKIESSDNLERHLFFLKEYFFKRKLREYSLNTLAKIARNEDVFEVLNSLSLKLQNLEVGNFKTEKTYKELLQLHLKTAEQIAKGVPVGISTGFTELDKMWRWEKQKFSIIAARPSMGKSALMLVLADKIAEQKKGVQIFSLEMTGSELIGRAIANRADLFYQDVRNYNYDSYKMAQLLSKGAVIEQLPIKIDDQAGINLQELKSKVLRNKKELGTEVVFIDYLQLMSQKAATREQEISIISRGLKQLAKDLDIHVCALCQLSRAVETRGGDKRPQLSDLRESGSLEQDADTVTLLYRAERYGIPEVFLNNGDAVNSEGVAELIHAKNRGGLTGTTMYNYVGNHMRFTDFEVNEDNLVF